MGVSVGVCVGGANCVGRSASVADGLMTGVKVTIAEKVAVAVIVAIARAVGCVMLSCGAIAKAIAAMT